MWCVWVVVVVVGVCVCVGGVFVFSHHEIKCGPWRVAGHGGRGAAFFYLKTYTYNIYIIIIYIIYFTIIIMYCCTYLIHITYYIL